MNARQYEEDIRGDLCVCGHFENEHEDDNNRECQGRVGNERCTCLGHRTRRNRR